jgi:hypothetical protein
MKEIFPHIYEVLPSKQTPSKYRSFFVRRDEGNFLVPCFSNSSTIEAHFAAIAALGGLRYQLLGDSHFRSAHNDEVAAHFNAPLYCSDVEAPDVTAKVKQVVTFPFTRHFLDAMIEVIPTPGHRAGGVCYLVSLPQKRVLFVGDFVWHDGAQWVTTPTKGNSRAYAESLRLLESLDFDLLLSNSQLNNPTFYEDFRTTSRSTFFGDLFKQLTESK